MAQAIGQQIPVREAIFCGVADKLRGNRSANTAILEAIGEPQSDPQREFIALVRQQEVKRPGYGGSRGGGKSWALRRAVVERRLNYPGSRGLILRRTYDELYGNHILPLIKAMPQGTYTYNASQHRITWPNGSIQEFGYCNNDRDVLRYHGQEFDDIAVDEAEQWQEQWIDQLSGSARTTRTDGLRPLLIVSFMPGGIGHTWVKRRWLDRDFLPNESADEYAFVRAKVYDNPVLMDADPDYVHMLESLPEELRRAWLDGDFDVFAGQYFRELRREVHGFEGDPPMGWTFRCMDYGEQSPSAVYWIRVDRDAVCWVYRELYGPGYSYSDLANKMVEMSVNPDGSPEQIRYTVTPPDLWAKRLNRYGAGDTKPVSGAEIMAKHGVPSIIANNDRIEGWRRMREFMRYPPKLRVHLDNCPHFWRTVPGLIHDEHNGEDLDTDGEDHCLVGDTMVDTWYGPRRIADMVGERLVVLTPAGWVGSEPVRLVWRDQPILRLTTSDGRTICATEDHQFHIAALGWRKLCDIERGAELTSLIPSDTIRYPVSGGKDDESQGTERHQTGVRWRGVLQVRSVLSAAWKAVTSYSLEMAQRRYTARLSCPPQGRQHGKQSDREPAIGVVCEASGRPYKESSEQYSERISPTGGGAVAQERVGQGVAQNASRTDGRTASPQDDTGLRELRQGIHVPSRPVLFKQLQVGMEAKTEVGCDGLKDVSDLWRAVQNGQVQASHVLFQDVRREVAYVESIEPAGKADVYCMTVPIMECFTVEHGILSHNSADGIRYGLSTRHISSGLSGWGRHVEDGEELSRQKRKGKKRDKVMGY